MTSLPDAGQLFEHAPCGLLLVTMDGVIQRANHTFCTWLGYSQEELRTRRVQDLLTIGARLFHQTHWAPLMQIQGSVAEVKMDAVHRDGHIIPMMFNAIRRRYGDDPFDEIAAVVVTDRQKYEAELRVERSRAEAAQARLKSADVRKDEFLATLAHELRNPLAPLRSVVQLLKLKTFEDEEVLWARDVLERQTTHMTLLVDDLLEMSRITQGKVRLRKKRLDLSQALNVALEAAEPFIAASKHVLTVTVPAEPVMVEADPTRVTQMMLNLLNNASKYTPDGGQIAVSIRQADGVAMVSVKDSGIGLPTQNLTTVFEMFSQVTPATQRTEGGLGIGLALVRGLAEMHGGSVSAASDGVGFGSTFTITLPLTETIEPEPEAVQATLKPPTPQPSESVTRRILVVDDNVDAADSLAILLEIQGHEIKKAHDGLEALAAFEEFQPDVVLLDIGLPKLDGYGVARRIRAHPSGTNVVLVALTGWGQQKDVDAALAAGFDQHATKPIDPGKLMSILRSNC